LLSISTNTKGKQTFQHYEPSIMLTVLGLSFYKRKDVVLIARELLGKVLVSCIDGQTCSGRIVETEAYVAITDRASHSFGGRRTARNEHMYHAAGTAYVYICYGIHPMFNVVTNDRDIPDAVLIRALEPLDGLPVMAKRSGKAEADRTITSGPGNLARAMGFSKVHSGLSLLGKDVYLLSDSRFVVDQSDIGISGRIGVEGAGAHAAAQPYRFYIRGNRYVSGRPK